MVHGLSFTHVDLGAVYEKGRLTLDRFAADSENGGVCDRLGQVLKAQLLREIFMLRISLWNLSLPPSEKKERVSFLLT